jgi:hypothetical protein
MSIDKVAGSTSRCQKKGASLYSKQADLAGMLANCFELGASESLSITYSWLKA